MIPPSSESMSRRSWMQMAAAPAVVAAMELALPTRLARAAMSNDPSRTLGILNARDFGAVGDGRTLDPAAIQNSIDAATADRGGVVLIPAGEFVIGPVELKSNVTLRISAG